MEGEGAGAFCLLLVAACSIIWFLFFLAELVCTLVFFSDVKVRFRYNYIYLSNVVVTSLSCL